MLSVVYKLGTQARRRWLLCLVVFLCCYLIFASHLSIPKLQMKTNSLVHFDLNHSHEPILKERNVTTRVTSKGNNSSESITATSAPLVTMFTTIRDRKCRQEIHNRLIRNWATLSPDLSPLLFVPHTELNASVWSDLAESQNWTVRILHSLRHDLPIIPAMFQEAIAISKSPFVGFANADILFDSSLIRTLRALERRVDVNNEMVMIIGRRKNVNITRFDIGSGRNLTKLAEASKTVGLLHGYAQDYFIISRRGLPWKEIPDFVVGRNGYDNWFVVKAQDWNITLVDATGTLLAVHQVGEDGLKSGSTTVPKNTLGFNKMLVKGFNYGRGSTHYAPYITRNYCRTESNDRCDGVGDIEVVMRQSLKNNKSSKKN